MVLEDMVMERSLSRRRGNWILMRLPLERRLAGGAYPLSGTIMKHGLNILNSNGKSALQSHTFAVSSQRPLMTATDFVLLELPTWMPSIAKHGEEMRIIFANLQEMSKGMIVGQGQGLMWGGLFTKQGQNADEAYRLATFDCFMKKCAEVAVLPFFVPSGGFHGKSCL